MAEIQQFVGEDSRKPIQRLTRFQLWREADARDLNYKNGATKDAMISLFEANEIDITDFQTVQWQAVNGTDSAGRAHQEIYPVAKPHASARSGIDARAVLDDRLTKKEEEAKQFEKARIDALERENAKLLKDNAALNETINERLSALEGKGKLVEKEVPDKLKPQSKYWALYRKAKELGKPVQSGMKMAELVELIGE